MQSRVEVGGMGTLEEKAILICTDSLLFQSFAASLAVAEVAAAVPKYNSCLIDLDRKMYGRNSPPNVRMGSNHAWQCCCEVSKLL